MLYMTYIVIINSLQFIVFGFKMLVGVFSYYVHDGYYFLTMSNTHVLEFAAENQTLCSIKNIVHGLSFPLLINN